MKNNQSFLKKRFSYVVFRVCLVPSGNKTFIQAQMALNGFCLLGFSLFVRSHLWLLVCFRLFHAYVHSSDG